MLEILTFCWLFQISWFFMIMMDHLKYFDDWKSFILKKLTKSQSLAFQCRWNFIRWSRNWLMKNVNFCDVLNQEIRSRCCIEDVKTNLQANRLSIEQKVNDSLSSIKTLIGRFNVDHEKKLGIWRSNVDDGLR